MRTNTNRIIILIILTFAIVSCRSVVTRNLTGRITLDEIKASSDTVDFYIKQIKLLDIERLKLDHWTEDAPGLNLVVTMTNKLNKNICLASSEYWSVVHFIGILPTEFNSKYDTIYFTNFSDDYSRILEPKSSIDFKVGNWTSINQYSYDETKLDNTDKMLNFVKRLKFYYAPSAKKEDYGQDTIVINSTYKLRTDKNTKIMSRSWIK